jgi:hypothetical protein
MFLIKKNATEVGNIVNHHHRQKKVKKSAEDQNVHTGTKRSPNVTEEKTARHKRQKLKVIHVCFNFYIVGNRKVNSPINIAYCKNKLIFKLTEL